MNAINLSRACMAYSVHMVVPGASESLVMIIARKFILSAGALARDRELGYVRQCSTVLVAQYCQLQARSVFL